MLQKAIFSECGKYRYVLRRSLNSHLRWVKTIIFVMLNPSTADAVEDDPTIRRCISFAEREGFTHMTVCNLFALRATNPKELLVAEDPIGPDNHWTLEREMTMHDFRVAAWGAHPFTKERAQDVVDRYGPFHCLGTNKDGSPKHPLYLAKSTQFKEFEI